MVGTFNTTFVTELRLKIPEVNHFAKNLRQTPFDGLIIKLQFSPR